ncbi:MAG: ECF transporter S component, partial [Oscillospiraceae bacterium]|nr:ECF transporter S component [Oscillospiraceae bacterium]
MKFSTKKLTLSAAFLGLGLVLPFLTGQVPQVGSMLLPMHIPVLLCGIICGWEYGLAVGAILPLLRSVIFGMPPIYPTALAMTFELAAYGAVIGFSYKKFFKGTAGVYLSLLTAMVSGRIVWGIAQAVLLGVGGKAFTISAFFAGAVLNAVPGIILQLLLVPA